MHYTTIDPKKVQIRTQDHRSTPPLLVPPLTSKRQIHFGLKQAHGVFALYIELGERRPCVFKGLVLLVLLRGGTELQQTCTKMIPEFTCSRQSSVTYIVNILLRFGKIIFQLLASVNLLLMHCFI
jgi:hypothetical protein